MARSFEDRMGCVEAILRVGLLWGGYLIYSLAVRALWPGLSLDLRPVTPLKLLIALAGLWGCFKVSGLVTLRTMGCLRHRMESGEDAGGDVSAGPPA
ncbi:hypothetical protein Taci_0263 [Thermanaerovibrio acidaminovorans DSM 6589]|uniref:Uncharacterized protein n=1 Tax=Thermanaerovibrio acidaminovorans (strain ATCC 49978 / DSM 6589 / Su883) TaxID=525903 RepID=D1B897_THEAS|nr:hypothetical protein [Thermanaerovibrio acidaminovorans]ACZ18500.1 hypothetical protein Taci_0263 [Thermanaerovibrio acidaminovorans DSM 6589]